MTTRPNHRRGTGRSQDNGSTWEGEPNDGGKGVRNGRKNWRTIGRRAERRTGKTSSKVFSSGRPRDLPDEESVDSDESAVYQDAGDESE